MQLTNYRFDIYAQNSLVQILLSSEILTLKWGALKFYNTDAL